MAGVKTYDPKNVQVILGGTPASGFTDGTFISVAPDEDLYTKTIGADGEASRARSNNKSATVTLTLKQTSSTNDVLSTFVAADQVSDSGVFPLMIKEIGSGRTLVFAQAAWVQRFPDLAYSKEVEDREWVIAVGQMDIFIGGNSFSGAAS
ncbi:phage structural protein [Rufibacter sediminis]|uniref:DUF3277 family protein n=1 Tax=Rufibacter sediminis TaxID=2762756 RepID=A0ABR6VU34_9BACT|nr:phage protein [Rufibacter sediminis]MBC3540659.1 DUF3277 family protein [Rufibacter sediminis]